MEVIQAKTILLEKTAQNPEKRPITPALDRSRYAATAKLTPFHAAAPTVMPRIGNADAKDISVHKA
jgi:hypothetical protein